jgi:predicted ATPase/signal transduction histidine kinase/DNA-binding response OmpR family regulator/tRNA A-37 threonylcarbamoyl transferase component Bud32
MFKISGYIITQQLHDSVSNRVYRGYRLSNQQPVIIKALPECPEPRQIAQFHHEYEMTKNLNLVGVVKLYELKKDESTWALIFEDIQGDSLKNILATHAIVSPPKKLVSEPTDADKTQKLAEITTFLTIAMQLTDSLAELHSHHIIHKDIKPANIIINLTTKQVKLTDLSIATRLNSENQMVSMPGLLEGTLGYMSPEQTGRMNRIIDYRTDFYSLGAVFYEMLLNIPIFISTEPLELVYCHLAKQPTPPHDINPAIPPAIANIVMKLLEKMAEKRYQSAYGLKADLQRCLQQWQTLGTIEEFPLGTQDFIDRFQLPQQLYGREAELATLLTTFEQIAQPPSGTPTHSTQLILINGHAGIGKTVLVNEIYKPVTEKRGYFVSGKFEQFQRNVPYQALVNAFAELIRQLLTESETHLAKWRRQLLAALGTNGQIIIDVIPEVELIIGKQPPVEILVALEAQNRFHRVFIKFVQTFASAKHPLVLFLDDLQWADLASFKLIEFLLLNSENQHLLIIGAYRHNEVNSTHPLRLTINEISKNKAIVHQIELKPLDLTNLTNFVAATLLCQLEKAQPLAQLLLQKTQGNPFFVTHFLKALHEDGWLHYNPEKGYWEYEVDQIQALAVTENVVEFMIVQLQKLTKPTQVALHLAACIGYQFDLATLATISAQSLAATAAALLPALQEGLLLPLSGAYKFYYVDNSTDSSIFSSEANVSYRFLHDRVQQASYSLIAESDKKAIHLKIGRLLLAKVTSTFPIYLPFLAKETQKHFENDIFNIVNHLNLGFDLIDELEYKNELAYLNLIAGQKAKSAIAYEQAVNYLRVGLECLTIASWQTHYELTRNIYTEAIEAEYLATHFEKAKQLSEIALNQAKTLLERVKIYEIIIQFHVAQNQIQQALDTALQVLQMLGVTLATEPPSHLQVETCYQLPIMTVPKALAAMRVLNFAISPTYTVAPELFPRVNFTMLNLCLEHGNSPLSAYTYLIYGTILCTGMERIEQGYEFCQLALTLLEKFEEAKAFKAKVLTATHVIITPIQKHVRECKVGLQEAIASGLETGDMEYACIAAMHAGSYLFFAGEALKIVNQQQFHYLEQMRSVKQEYQAIYLNIWRQVVLNLQGETTARCYLQGEAFDEETLLPQLLASNYGMAIFATYLAKTMLCYWFKDTALAHTHVQSAAKYERANLGIMTIPLLKFYYSLVLLAEYPHVNFLEKQRYLTIIAKNQTDLQFFAKHAPMNYQHKYDLVEAERAKIAGQFLEAMALYDKAIQGAKTQEYQQEVALAYELAAEFYLTLERYEIAQTYLRKAHYYYRLWGARSKVHDMEARHSDFLQPLVTETSDFTLGTTQVSTTLSSSLTIASTSRTSSLRHREVNNLFDITTVMKASQAISEEMRLQHLITKMMWIVMENIGAQRGCLILGTRAVVQQPLTANLVQADVSDTIVKPVEDFQVENEKLDTEFRLEAEAKISSKQLIFYTLPLAEAVKLIPLTIIHYILRTQTPLVLDSANSSSLFTHDPYVQHQQLQSVLGMPILYHGRLTGVLYFENNSITNAFTAERLAVVKILAGQIAVSIQNALLYQQHELARQEAEAANRAKTIFLANMSHELRTPLNGILGHAQILGFDKQLSDEHLESVKIIHSCGQYLLTLINDILDISKLETDRLELYLTDFNFRSLLQEIIDLFKLRAKEKGITFMFLTTSHLPEGVRGDEKRLRQVLINLLSNAIKFTQQGAVQLRVNRINGKIRFEVVDTGIGIAPADIEKVFLPFRQVGDEKYWTEGAGLGLSISQRLTKLMGGELRVESALGYGSRFWLDLELPDTSELMKPSSSTSAAVVGYEGFRQTVLVVDDKWENRALLLNILKPLGFEVIEAENGQTGLSRALFQKPHLVITDLVMPVMDGFELTRQLRQREEFNKVPIIVTSASVIDNGVQNGLNEGCNAFLGKPFHLKELLAVIGECLKIKWKYEENVEIDQVANEMATVVTNVTNTLSANNSFDANLALPSQVATELFELAMMGDIGGILEKVNELEQSDSKWLTFTQQLRHLAKEFKEEEICRLVEPYR